MYDICMLKYRCFYNYLIVSYFKGLLFKLGINRYIEKRKNGFVFEL